MDNNDSPYRKDFGKVSEQAKRFWREVVEPLRKRLNLKRVSATNDEMLKERIAMTITGDRDPLFVIILQMREAMKQDQTRATTISPKRSPLSDVSFPATGDFFPEELL